MTLLDLTPIVWSGIAVLCGVLSIKGDRYAGAAAISAALSLALSLCSFQPYIQCAVFFSATIISFTARFVINLLNNR